MKNTKMSILKYHYGLVPHTSPLRKFFHHALFDGFHRDECLALACCWNGTNCLEPVSHLSNNTDDIDIPYGKNMFISQ